MFQSMYAFTRQALFPLFLIQYDDTF